MGQRYVVMQLMIHILFNPIRVFGSGKRLMLLVKFGRRRIFWGFPVVVMCLNKLKKSGLWRSRIKKE